MEHHSSIGRSPVRTVFIVRDDELENQVFLADVKTFASKLHIPRRRFVDWLVDGMRDSEVELVDQAGNPATIQFDAIERDHIDLWFRDWCKRPRLGQLVRVRLESRERVRLVATMLRMIFPKESSVWGR